MEKEIPKIQKIILLNKGEISETRILMERNGTYELITLVPDFNSTGNSNPALIKQQALTEEQYKELLSDLVLEMNNLSKNNENPFLIYGKSDKDDFENISQL